MTHNHSYHNRFRILVAALILFCAVFQQDLSAEELLPEDITNMLMQVQAQLDADDPAAGLALFGTATENHHPDVQVMLGLCYDRLQQLDAAIDAYEHVLEHAPERHNVVFALLNCLVRAERWPAVVNACAAHLDTARCQEEALLLYADSLRRTADSALARHIAQHCLVRFPHNVSARRLLINLALEHGDPAVARQHIDTLLAVTPDDAVLWRYRVHCAADDTERRQLLQVAIVADPDNTELRLACAQATYEAGQTTQALAHVQILMETNSRVYRDAALGIAAGSQAWEQCRAWLAVVPEHKRSAYQHRIAAQTSLALDDTTSARAAFAQLLQMGEHDEALLLRAADLAEQDDDLPVAESYYRQAITLHTSTIARLYVARLLIRLGRNADAQTELEQTLLLEPNNEAAQRMLQLVVQQTH